MTILVMTIVLALPIGLAVLIAQVERRPVCGQMAVWQRSRAAGRVFWRKKASSSAAVVVIR